MFAAAIARALAARGIHYGWLMVVLVFLYGMCSAGAMSIPGVLLTPMSEDLGWSIGGVSGPLGLRMTLFGLVAPFAGGLILLYGLRKVLTWSAILLIAGLLAAITMTAKWQLWLALGVAIGCRARHDRAGIGYGRLHTLVHRPTRFGLGLTQRR